jgi:Common central domain of tyrosinase
MAIKRPNQKNLSAREWDDFINAVNAMHGIGTTAPAYRDFVRLHADAMSMAGMSWGVHTMPSMGVIGVNFLAWHRRFIFAFEKRLGVPLPYWDWIADPQIPARLNDPSLLASWGATRSWNRSEMPTQDQLESQIRPKRFSVFQRSLELGAHAAVHIAIGGTMNSPSSPTDPIFFLHHANLDRIWSEWQVKNPRSNPTNKNEILQRPPIEGVKVSSVLSISSLGYSYIP